jgi:hypothetical protein
LVKLRKRKIGGVQPMSKHEFLKNAVSNMDRDVKYEYSNSGTDKEANNSVKETDPTNLSDDDTAGRFN